MHSEASPSDGVRGDSIGASKENKQLEGVTCQWEKSGNMEKKALTRLNFDLKLQHSSFPALLPLVLGPVQTYHSSKPFPSKLNSSNWNCLGNPGFTGFFIFMVRGKQILISPLYTYSPLSPLLIFSGSVLIYCHHAAFVKQYHKVRKRTFPKDYSKINYFRPPEAA